MIKQLRIIYSLLGVTAGLGVILALKAASYQQARIERAESRMAEVCGLVKSALRVDRNILTAYAEPYRERTLAQFATDRIGDGYQMLDWCVPHTAMRVATVRACELNYECASSALLAMETAVR